MSKFGDGVNMGNTNDLIGQLLEEVKQQEKIQSVKAKRDCEVEGRTASYPVDMYWEFDAENGIHYKILFDMQHMERAIDRNDLFHFANVMQDISGQVMGVVFTQPVYDKLVKDVARDVGIFLYEMTGTNDASVWQPEVSNLHVEVDKEWAQQEKAKHGLENEQISYGGQLDEIFFYNGQDICLDSMQGIIREEIKKRHAQNEFTQTRVLHAFCGEPMYLKTGHELIPKVKVNGVSFDLVFYNITQMEVGDMVEKILQAALQAKLM